MNGKFSNKKAVNVHFFEQYVYFLTELMKELNNILESSVHGVSLDSVEQD